MDLYKLRSVAPSAQQWDKQLEKQWICSWNASFSSIPLCPSWYFPRVVYKLCCGLMRNPVVIRCLAAFQASARAGSPIGCFSMALTWVSRKRGPSTAGTLWRKPHQVHLVPVSRLTPDTIDSWFVYVLLTLTCISTEKTSERTPLGRMVRYAVTPSVVQWVKRLFRRLEEMKEGQIVSAAVCRSWLRVLF